MVELEERLLRARSNELRAEKEAAQQAHAARRAQSAGQSAQLERGSLQSIIDTLQVRPASPLHSLPPPHKRCNVCSVASLIACLATTSSRHQLHCIAQFAPRHCRRKLLIDSWLSFFRSCRAAAFCAT